MIKYFCDKCGVELSAEEVRYSLDMIGKALCFKHAHEYTDKKTNWKYEKKWDEDKPYKFPPLDDPIICPRCGKESGYTKNGIMLLVIQNDLLCKHCGGIVIKARRVICRDKSQIGYNPPPLEVKPPKFPPPAPPDPKYDKLGRPIK